MADAGIEMLPQSHVKLREDEHIKNIEKILALLEEDDDVQEVFHNWDE